MRVQVNPITYASTSATLDASFPRRSPQRRTDPGPIRRGPMRVHPKLVSDSSIQISTDCYWGGERRRGRFRCNLRRRQLPYAAVLDLIADVCLLRYINGDQSIWAVNVFVTHKTACAERNRRRDEH